ncbi:hypothetical protein BDV38DRAFT_276445 [Aspergillus pseudotamarii]|uniref:Uncharacterized protein n=1 Tax=Aspergillus pseudotamarii TaxID=132259 RepID=A0A5N6SBT4_ASPPS|nr:uncharacterized protein BDV38DRAFT_276445 [Aspergillus pseudotamarii]KAE8130863.1 hypothetical protein BDV38DRAFT_276445 [Aspergillus pseudotamarii]
MVKTPLFLFIISTGSCNALSLCAGRQYCPWMGPVQSASEPKEDGNVAAIELPKQQVHFSRLPNVDKITGKPSHSEAFSLLDTVSDKLQTDVLHGLDEETTFHDRTWASRPGNRAMSSLDWATRWEKAMDCLSSKELENVDMYEMDELALAAFWDRVWGCYVPYAGGRDE